MMEAMNRRVRVQKVRRKKVQDCHIIKSICNIINVYDETNLPRSIIDITSFP